MGGMGTNAYVSNWYSIGDGEKMVIGGLIQELIGDLCLSGEAAPTPATLHYSKDGYTDPVGFNPEALKRLFVQALSRSWCRSTLLHTTRRR